MTLTQRIRSAALETDPVLLVAAGLLSVLGVLMTWSATRADSGSAYLLRGGINVTVAVALAAAILLTPPRLVRAAVPFVYGAACLLLVAVLSPLGSTINGSRSWIQLPGFSLQPAELAKVATALGLAAVFSDAAQRRRSLVPGPPDWPVMRTAAIVAAIPLGLVMLQPDLGSGLVLLALILTLAALARVRRWIMLTAFAAIAAAITVALTTPVLAAYQRDRLIAFIQPERDPSGIGYQVAQVKLAIGSGGLFGEGLFAGNSTQGGFIPFQYTDFIFSVAGEELGFVGALSVVALEFLVVWRILAIARGSTDEFSRLICAGSAGWLAFQACENIGMNLGLMPVTGVPLPFVSYGGSSMFACWIAVGLAANAELLRRRRLW